jgi:hypothetical protein
MVVDFPDGTVQTLADIWRVKFDDAYRHYSENRTAEARAEVTRALRTLSNLLLRNKLPSNSE